MFRRTALAVPAIIAVLALAVTASVADASTELFTGQTAGSGQELASADGHYALTMQTDGCPTQSCMSATAGAGCDSSCGPTAHTCGRCCTG